MAKAKKRTYKKVFKGVRFIANQLVKYYPSRYSSYTKALPRAREIVSELQSSNTKVTWGSAKRLEVSKTHEIYGDRYLPKDKEVVKPLLSEILTTPFPAFEKDTIINGIEDSSSELHFVADFIEEDVVGGVEPDYYRDFALMVADVDNYRRETLGGISSDTICHINFTKPIFNKFSKRYESRIYITAPNGDIVSVDVTEYGSQMSEDDILGFISEKAKGTTKKDKKTTVKSNEIEPNKEKLTAKQQIEIEKEKTKQKISETFNLLLKSGINPKEAQKMLKDMGLT